MTVNIVFPPQWTPLSPHCAPTVLAAELKKAGFNSKVIDLNIDYYDKILTLENMYKQLTLLSRQRRELTKFIKEEFDPKQDPSTLSDDVKIKIKKYSAIINFQKMPSEDLLKIIESLPEAVEVFRDKNQFYDLEKFQPALFTIDFCLNLMSLVYYPWELTLHDYMNPYFKFTWENIQKELNDNIFSEYLFEEADEIIANEPELIGISVSSSSEFVAALTLARILKGKTDIPVFLGGNYISRLTDTLQTCPEFFETFTNYVIYEEGERAIVDLARYFKGEIKIDEVSSLIYYDGENIKMNPKHDLVKLNDTATQLLDGYSLRRYLLPEIVLPIQASRGCYWRKCTFCDHDFGQTYNVKSIPKLVDEIEEIQNKYGISHFEFVDEAIAANYLENFSEHIIRRGLKINWYCNCRLESNLTYDIFKKAREAGLRMILWGYESGSKRIMEMINKGVDIDRRLDILRAANDADIWNFAYIFFGFPTETIKDAMDTVHQICDNIDIIPAYGRSVFTLGKHALMKANPSDYGIENLRDDLEPFSSNCSYDMTDGLFGKELNTFMQNFTKKSIKAYDYPVWMSIRYRETLFLYICKYSMAEVKKMKSDLLMSSSF